MRPLPGIREGASLAFTRLQESIANPPRAGPDAVPSSPTARTTKTAKEPSRCSATATPSSPPQALSLAFFAGTGAAHAGSLDDDFLDNISSEGIAFTSERAAVQEGNLVCNYLAHGRTGTSIGSEILSNSDLTAHQAAVFVVEAASTYCPGYMDQVTA